ncbi:MAG: CDC2/CDK family serine/threonine-protein kinase [archaeon]|nr:CDC2/CDK family serine/threonine-protein kinase [archaeon]
MIKKIPKYKILSKIGEGTYGIVYKAQDVQSNDIVVLKKAKFKPEEEGTPSIMIREISLLRELDHPNIVNLIDIIHTSEKLTMVFEYCDSDLRKEMDKSTKLTPILIKKYLYQLLKGTEYLHKYNIMHRDLKPQNLLINDKGILKICDFGLARADTIPVRGYSNEVVTLYYRSPDVLLGNKLYDCSVDIWSIGCIFGEMLLNKPVFEGTDEPDQLKKIFTILGTPNEDEFPWLLETPEWNCTESESFKGLPKKEFKECFKEIIDEKAVDLMEKMLLFNQEERITAEQALNHSYFDNIRDKMNDIYN